LFKKDVDWAGILPKRWELTADLLQNTRLLGVSSVDVDAFNGDVRRSLVGSLNAKRSSCCNLGLFLYKVLLFVCIQRCSRRVDYLINGV